MIFSNRLDDKVRDGSKTQTRRLVKDGDRLLHWPMACIFRRTKSGDDIRLMWRVGQTYAIQSGRGKKGNGRFGIFNIRKERLQDISIIDFYVEGIVEVVGHWPEDDSDEGSGPVNIRKHFGKMWNSIHKKPSDRWEDNPSVWVLEIEPI